MVLNQTLGLNSLRQDLNRLFYSAPIGASAFAPNSFYGPSGFYGPTAFYAQPNALFGQANAFFPQHAFYAPQSAYGQNVSGFQGHFVPKANVAETPDASVITIELPGVELGQVSLGIHGNALVLEGVRQPGGLIGNQMITYQHAEGRFGNFRWACPIPNGTMAPQIEATFRNGLLTIVLPKATAQIVSNGLVGQATISPAPVAQIVINPAVNA